MATNLSAADITAITDIVQQNQSNEYRPQLFNGNPNEAASWMEDFIYNADALNWNDDKRRTKLGASVIKAARDWYYLNIQGTNMNWRDVVDAFNKQFIPAGYEMKFKKEFRTRKQQLFEPSANFIVSMRATLKKSKLQMPELEAVQQIVENMLPEIAVKVIPMKPNTFDELKEKANLIEIALKTLVES